MKKIETPPKPGLQGGSGCPRCCRCVLLLFSFFVNAPLLDKAKPLVSPNPSKAPWYFMGFQELLMHMHPAFASFLIPLFVIELFIVIPFLPYSRVNSAVWFYSEKGKKITIQSAIFTLILTLLLIFVDDLLLDFNHWFPGFPALITEGVFPVLLYFVPAGGWMYYLKKKLKADRMELVIASVTIYTCCLPGDDACWQLVERRGDAIDFLTGESRQCQVALKIES